jgi:hypothetical protein
MSNTIKEEALHDGKRSLAGGYSMFYRDEGYPAR